MKKLTLFLASLSVLLLAGCAQSPEKELNKFYQGNPPETKANVQSNNQKNMKFDQTAKPKKGEQIVVMKTSMGTIKIRLFPKKAPKTVENFAGLVDKGYYDGILFHRVIPDFMIQGGDPSGTGRGGESLWGGKFEDEFNDDLKNIKGALSMANAGPNTNGSQFFIVQAEATPWLDGKHSVFGQVFDGMDVVEKIVNVERDSRDKPLKDVKMEKVTLEKY